MAGWRMLTDPTPLYRLRDGAYASDLLIVAVAHLDLFSWLHRLGGANADRICREWSLDARPVDVMLTYLGDRSAVLARKPG
jgi:hypothetical protein